MTFTVEQDRVLVMKRVQRKGSLYLALPHRVVSNPVMKDFRQHLNMILRISRRAPEAFKDEQLNLMHMAYILYAAAAAEDEIWLQHFWLLLKAVCGFPRAKQDYTTIINMYPDTVPRTAISSKTACPSEN